MDGTGASLGGTEWTALLPGGSRASLAFAEGRVSGSSGVNRLTGGVTIEGDRISFGALATTRMAGPPWAMAAEQAFLLALERVAAWSVDGERLTLLADDGSPVLELARA